MNHTIYPSYEISLYINGTKKKKKKKKKFQFILTT